MPLCLKLYIKSSKQSNCMKKKMEIKLSNGFVTLVSEQDYPLINKWRWRKNKQGYAVRNIKNKQISIHQLIMGSMEGYEIDHINRNKLDNRRENLRFVTRSQNNFNRDPDPRNKLGYNGISLCSTGSYRVRVSTKDIGRYKTLNEAIEARRIYVDALFNREVSPLIRHPKRRAGR